MRELFAKFIKEHLKPDFLLIACGLPGTWKTETTEEVAKIKDCKLLRTDLIRLEVLKSEDVFDEKVAGDMSKRTQVYDEMFRQADEALSSGNCVILDATYDHAFQHLWGLTLLERNLRQVERLGARFVHILVGASNGRRTIRRRFPGLVEPLIHPVSDPDMAVLGGLPQLPGPTGP